MTTLFISDLHLDASRPHITRLFLDFLENEASKAKALYILGDLFEAWIGDDASDEIGDMVADGLARLHERGVPCFFIHGNRDFLLGDAYARRARMTLLADFSLLEIEQERVLLMHGDVLCTDDLAYQEFRNLTRRSQWQREFLAQSKRQRIEYAARARTQSRQHMNGLPEAIKDVNESAVDRAFVDSQSKTIIHGHTHRPAIHHAPSGTGLTRVVLGDWYEQGSLLRADDSRMDLVGLEL